MTSSVINFLNQSPAPNLAVNSSIKHTAAKMHSKDLAKGEVRYIRRGGGSVFLYYLPSTWEPKNGLLLLGAHTDSPNLRIKANPDYNSEGYQQLLVQPYGGLLSSTWMDRELGLAGEVFLNENGSIQRLDFLLDKPIALIPNLAIHLNRGVNEKGLVLNKQKHLNPVFTDNHSKQVPIEKIICNHLGIDPAKILSYELSLFPIQPAALTGLNEEFLTSARLDNLLSCFCACEAMVKYTQQNDQEKGLIVCLFDHEEVGSESPTGAGSNFLDESLALLANGMELNLMKEKSVFLSLDMSHGVHPNYAEMHDQNHKPLLNKGPVLKIHQEQRYATSAAGQAFISLAAKEGEIPLQVYQHRSDLGCGSTIGPIAGARAGVETIDLGNAMWAMHSSRETCGAHDITHLVNLILKATDTPLP
jgi:aspartyl aminopeptidase